MPTLKKRLNISLAPEIESMVRQLAKRDQMPEATKAGQLLQVALEIEEDSAWDAIASQRDMKGSKFISHKKAWA